MSMWRWWNDADRGMRKELEEMHVPLLTPYRPTQSQTRTSKAIGCHLNTTAYRTSSIIITCSIYVHFILSVGLETCMM